MRHRASWLTVAALALFAALPALSGARVPDAGASATCAKETKRIKAFQRGMKAAKRRFFRTHRSAKARARFVKRQKRQLAGLRRARKRCLARPPATSAPSPAPGSQPAPAPGGAPTPTPSPQPGGTARDAIVDVASPRAEVTDAEVSTEDGVQYVRTQLELELTPGATAAEMAALLDRLDAEVVSSLEGVGLLTVRIPDPGSLAALRELAAGLSGAPGLAHADVLTVPVTTELPDIQPADAGLLRPQLASRAHAMWNARAALDDATPPTLLIADFFGAGPPGPEVAVAEAAADFATSNLTPHGYTVLGMAAGTFEPGAVANLQADRVAGMWAGPDLPLRAIDLKIRIAGSTLHDRILQRVGGLGGDVVVNTSLADGCVETGCTEEEIHRNALQWIQRVRGSGLEDRFLHVSSAGNIYEAVPDDLAAWRASAVNAAALTPLPGGVQNLTNTVVVENTTASDPAGGAIVPACLTDSSKRGGHVSAVGNDIKSFGAPGVFRDLPAGGTSNAAPQVAGTAATVWALAPALSPAQVAGILRATARPVDDSAATDPRCAGAPAAPALDAHAAVLAADSAVAAPARAAMLDADGNGVFEAADLQEFAGAFDAAAGALDYGRHDLNADGRTGGAGRDRVELDASAPPAWTFSRRRAVLGLEVGHDETAVRDLDVLCHEAHGPLFEGDEAARDTFAEQHCLPPVEIAADPPLPASLEPGQSAPLRVVARRSDLTDATVSVQPGVHLTFQAVSGTVTPASGLTGPDGAFTATAALGATGGFEAVVIARAGEDGPELDRLTVRASRAGASGTMSISQLRSEAAAVVSACAFECVTDRDEEGSSAFGPFTGTASASRTKTGEGTREGWSGTASADASQDSTITHAGGRLEVTASGSSSGSAQRTGEGNAVYTGQAAISFRVQVSGGSVPYRATGTLSGPGTTFSILPAGGQSPFLELEQNRPYDRSGTLAPGVYDITMGAGCGGEVGDLGTFQPTCSNSYSSSLVLGA